MLTWVIGEGLPEKITSEQRAKGHGGRRAGGCAQGPQAGRGLEGPDMSSEVCRGSGVYLGSLCRNLAFPLTEMGFEQMTDTACLIFRGSLRIDCRGQGLWGQRQLLNFPEPCFPLLHNERCVTSCLLHQCPVITIVCCYLQHALNKHSVQ